MSLREAGKAPETARPGSSWESLLGTQELLQLNCIKGRTATSTQGTLPSQERENHSLAKPVLCREGLSRPHITAPQHRGLHLP